MPGRWRPRLDPAISRPSTTGTAPSTLCPSTVASPALPTGSRPAGSPIWRTRQPKPLVWRPTAGRAAREATAADKRTRSSWSSLLGLALLSRPTSRAHERSRHSANFCLDALLFAFLVVAADVRLGQGDRCQACSLTDRGPAMLSASSPDAFQALTSAERGERQLMNPAAAFGLPIPPPPLGGRGIRLTARRRAGLASNRPVRSSSARRRGSSPA